MSLSIKHKNRATGKRACASDADFSADHRRCGSFFQQREESQKNQHGKPGRGVVKVIKNGRRKGTVQELSVWLRMAIVFGIIKCIFLICAVQTFWSLALDHGFVLPARILQMKENIYPRM